MEALQWSSADLADVKLGDVRLERRARRVVDDLSQNPGGSIAQISGDWAATKAAYDFFNNDQVDSRQLVNAERQATLRRVSTHGLVLGVQDTTEINLTRYKSIEGIGLLSRNEQKGFFVHSSLAVSADGVPLGLLAQEHWVRTEKADPKAKRQRQIQRPIEEKESYKWLKSFQQSTEDLPDSVNLLFVSDAESDVHEYFALPRPARVDILVRACQNRRLLDSELLLWSSLRQTPLAGTVEVEVRRTDEQPMRTAHCEVRFRQVQIRPSNSNRAKHLPRLKPISLYAVLVEETAPPEGTDPISWLLLTSCSVTTFEEALQIIRYYSYRWRIERFHFVLKSGCRIEQRRLQSVTAMVRFLALANIVAWRLLWLTYLARLSPDESCALALEPHEWQALFVLTHSSTTFPAQPPSLHLALRWLAQLGGFLGRSSDGEPGVQSLWKGWTLLVPAARLFLLMRPPPISLPPTSSN